MNTGDYEDTLTNLGYTFSLDKVSCIKGAWPVHVAFALLTVASGVLCFVTRIFDRIQWMHQYFGRMYIVSMLWCMGTSLVIHNTGLPVAVLLSFLWVLGGLTVGWMLIKIHQSLMEHEASNLCMSKIHKDPIFLSAMMTQGISYTVMQLKKEIADKRNNWQRLFSFKAAHGILMFVSFINVAGRIFGVNLNREFSCHTFPYYKQVDSSVFKGNGKSLTPVEIHDDKFNELPWAHGIQFWAVEFSMGAIIAAHGMGWMYIFFAWLFSKLECVASCTRSGKTGSMVKVPANNLSCNPFSGVKILKIVH